MASMQSSQHLERSRLERFISGPWPWLIPSIVVLVIFRMFPIISQFWYSMTDIVVVDLDAAQFVGFNNYRYLLTDPGFMGAFTTFSTYMMGTSNLIRDGKYLLAGVNVAVQSVMAIAVFFVGLLALGRLI